MRANEAAVLTSSGRPHRAGERAVSHEAVDVAAANGGSDVSSRVETVAEAARIAAAHWELGGGALVVGRPPDESLDDVEPLIEQALAAAAVEGVHGQAVTPFVLDYLHRESGGRTLRANSDLIVGNARLAGEVAAAAPG